MGARMWRRFITPSPRRGEDGARRAPGEGVRPVRLIAEPPHPSPLPAGERGLVATATSDQQLLPDRFKNAVSVLKHVVVPKAQHTIAEGFDDFGSRSIGFGRMLASIELDGEVSVAAGEIRDMGADRELADEFSAFELPGPKVTPEPLFGVGRISPELSRDRCQALLRQCRTPSPQPSARRGEGAVRHVPNRVQGSAPVNA